MSLKHAQIALAVERAVRAAARSGNRLLSGSTARVEVADAETREVLTQMLARMGARLALPGAAADFAFVADLATDHSGGAGDTAPAEYHGQGLPETVVSLAGDVRSARGSDEASRITWAARGMPATAAMAGILADGLSEHPPRVAISLILEPKTAAFALTLADAGCEVALFSAVSETDPEIAAALAADGRVAVYAPTTAVVASEADQVDRAHAAAVLSGWSPEYLIDDGAHLIRLAHTEQPAVLERLIGAAEETTSGVRPLLEMTAERQLSIPVIAVNDARTKTNFDNLIGTGQSCVFAIADLLDTASWQPPAHAAAPHGYTGVAGTNWTVIGYGPVGVGTARFAAALGAHVTVVERDPVRALAALHDGFEARSMAEAIAAADVVVSATGMWHTLTAAHFQTLRPGAAVAVAGGIDDELALDELCAAGWHQQPSTTDPGVTEWRAPGLAAGPLVLAHGGGVNYTAAEGNPIEVMDLSFATQVAALVRLMRERLEPGVHALSVADEALVARAVLRARGGSADPAPIAARTGGAAQPWATHRYRSAAAQPRSAETS